MNRGNLLIILFCVSTFSLWLLSKTDKGFSIATPLIYISQISALLGTICISIEYVLSARYGFLEQIFGGLDKVYKSHHTIGIVGYSFILSHIFFLVLSAFPTIEIMKTYILPSDILSYSLGVFAFYIMTLLIFITIGLNMPYNLWKITHTLFGIPLIIVSAHILLITSDVSTYKPLKIWIMLFVVAAIFSFLYKLLFYNLLIKSYKYIVDGVYTKGNITELYLKPIDKRLKFRAGEFVFAKFESEKVSREPHPFTISSSPNQSHIRFSIKDLGDYTAHVKDIKRGDKVFLKGPYGDLGNKFDETNKPQVWIAGGIGITPFLAKVNDGVDKDIYLYYCTRDKDEAIYDEEIKHKAVMQPQIHYNNHCSAINGHLDKKRIEEEIGGLGNKKFFICGPLAMIESFKKDLTAKGVKKRDIIIEDFNFK